MPRFCRFELRTPDVDAARAFYAAVPGFPSTHAIVQLPAEAERVAWLTLHTPALEASLRAYAAAFGWHATRALELGALGHGHDFAWGRGGPSVGSLLDSAGQPGVHPHWFFHFGVPSLDAAVDAIRARGSRVTGVFAEVAVCEDPLGAAFAARGE